MSPHKRPFPRPMTKAEVESMRSGEEIQFNMGPTTSPDVRRPKRRRVERDDESLFNVLPQTDENADGATKAYVAAFYRQVGNKRPTAAEVGEMLWARQLPERRSICSGKWMLLALTDNFIDGFWMKLKVAIERGDLPHFRAAKIFYFDTDTPFRYNICMYTEDARNEREVERAAQEVVTYFERRFVIPVSKMYYKSDAMTLAGLEGTIWMFPKKGIPLFGENPMPRMKRTATFKESPEQLCDPASCRAIFEFQNLISV